MMGTDMFLGRPYEYWIELQYKAEQAGVANYVEEIAALRSKVSYYESRIQELTGSCNLGLRSSPMDERQYVIMFGDFPEEVCVPGTTQEQASLRVAQIKQEYLKSNPTVNPLNVYVKSSRVRVYHP